MKPKSRTIPGVNIQWPWSQLLLSGEKTVETRSYAIPDHYLGVELAIIETPGPRGKKEAGIESARIVGTIVFDGCFEYLTKGQWTRDRSRHLVSANDSMFAFDETKPKWGWSVAKVKVFAAPVPAPKSRGIVFAKECRVPIDP